MIEGGGAQRKLLAIVLLTTLVLAAAVLVPSLGSLGSLVGREASHGSSPAAGEEAGGVSPGVLLIDVSFERRSSSAPLMGLISRYEPMQGTTILISRTDQPSTPPLAAVTNNTGFLRFKLHPSGDYVVTLRDSRINLTVPLQVFGDRITSLIIRANRVSNSVLLEDVNDGELSGWIMPGQKFFMETPSVGYHDRNNGTTLFLETNPALRPFDVLRPGDVSLTSVVVVAEQTGKHSTWMELESTTPLRVTDMANSTLIDYTPSYAVSVR